MMQIQAIETKELLLEIANLREELFTLKQDKDDLELLLETTLTHAETIEIQLQESNQQLQAEIIERQRTESVLKALTEQLQYLLNIVNRDKKDLEIILETTTEHGDLIGAFLQDKAEEAKLNSEKQLSQFLEAVPVGIRILDANGKHYYSNRQAKLIFNNKCESSGSEDSNNLCQVYVAGTNELYPPAQLPSMRALRGETTTVDDLEIHADGKVICLEVWGTPIFDENGKIAYAIVAFQDISQRKKAETERQKSLTNLFNLNEALSRFVPNQFLHFLSKKSIVDVRLGDQVQQEMSVLFADIRNFTGLSENMTPQESFNFINAYLSRMEPAIIENQGFIDKYIGDEIMALFNGGADNAVQAGISMLKRLNEYNQHRLKFGNAPINIGIGINTGSLILGTVGGASRMDSTVISDTVNLASRIEKLTKNYGVSLLISDHTFLQIQDYSQYAFRIINRLKVRGKAIDVSIYEIFDAEPPEIYEGKLATKQDFEQALLLYHLGSFREAAQLFGHCLYLNPKDTVAQLYRTQCQERIT